MQQKAWSKANPGKAATYCKKWRVNNPDKAATFDHAWYVNNRGKKLAADKARRESNMALFIERERKSYVKHAEARSRRHKRWSALNSQLIASYSADRRAARSKSTPRWLGAVHYDLIVMFYEIAKVLQNTTGKSHHVDHIVPLRGKIVCGLHVPWNLQVIPSTDNLKKSNRYWPHMP